MTSLESDNTFESYIKQIDLQLKAYVRQLEIWHTMCENESFPLSAACRGKYLYLWWLVEKLDHYLPGLLFWSENYINMIKFRDADLSKGFQAAIDVIRSLDFSSISMLFSHS